MLVYQRVLYISMWNIKKRAWRLSNEQVPGATPKRGRPNAIEFVQTIQSQTCNDNARVGGGDKHEASVSFESSEFKWNRDKHLPIALLKTKRSAYHKLDTISLLIVLNRLFEWVRVKLLRVLPCQAPSISIICAWICVYIYMYMYVCIYLPIYLCMHAYNCM